MTQTVVKTTTLQNRVEELFETLEKLVDHRSRSEAAYKGINAKPHIREYLEGWDFIDLAGDRNPFYLKCTALPLRMPNWVDFTHAIQAVTLFGRGFGNLITPSGSTASLHNEHRKLQQSCIDWATVPTGQYYLCMRVADLGRVADQIGNLSTRPMTIAPGVVWRTSGNKSSPMFSRCACGQAIPAPSPGFKEASIYSVQEFSSDMLNFLHG